MSGPIEQHWQAVLTSIRSQVAEHIYNMWFSKLSFQRFESGQLELSVESTFLRDWLHDNYLGYITTEARRSFPGSVDTVLLSVRTDGVLPPPATGAARPSVERERKGARKAVQAGLNPRFSFDNFIIGGSNEFAAAACRNVAENPGRSYNPLYIYGGTGLGKTHLLQAVGLEIGRRHPALRIVYTTSERFTSELVRSIAAGGQAMADFKRRYRESCDVLLIDDIQFIAGKSATQEEFFHTFNALAELNKQIILTSDAYPIEMKGFDKRLRSRFQMGLVADIREPEYETRLAILERKAAHEQIQIDRPVLEMVARSVRSNIRELEGCLVRLQAYLSLTGARIDCAMAREVLRQLMPEEGPAPTCDSVIQAVCRFYDLRPTEIRSERRHRTVVVPRQVAMYLCRRRLNIPYTEIGNAFGGRNHATVISSVTAVEKKILSDPETVRAIEAIERSLDI